MTSSRTGAVSFRPGVPFAPRTGVRSASVPGALAIAIFGLTAGAVPSFTDVTDDAGVRVTAPKLAGAAVADLDADGCPDLVVNARLSTGAGASRYFRSRCGPAWQFDDLTSSHLPSLLGQGSERALAVGDLNGDGHPELVRNGGSFIEVAFNGGPQASPPWSFLVTRRIPGGNPFRGDGGLNAEGLALLDVDADGDLDVLIQDWGLELFLNDGLGGLSYASVPWGLPQPATDTNGEYLAVADYDDDGDVDVLARLNQSSDLWTNLGNVFAPGLNIEPSNDNKGDATFCDLDGDGDLDFFWSDFGTVGENAVWTQRDRGVFLPGPRLVGNQAIAASACGDLDNDGWPDLVLGVERFPDGGSGGLPLTDLLLLNQRDGGFSPLPTGPIGPGEARTVVLSDLDQDGDLDLLLTEQAGSELWRNELDDGLSLAVEAKVPSGPGERDALGATARLESCTGAAQSGLRELSGGTGRGTFPSPQLHFGLGGRPLSEPLVVRVRFVGGQVVRRAIVPEALAPPRRITVRPGDATDLAACGAVLEGAHRLEAHCGVPLSVLLLSGSGGAATLRSPAGELPEGLQFDPASGSLTWTPTRAQAGSHPLVLSVSTAAGDTEYPLEIDVQCTPRNSRVGCGCGSPGAGPFALLLAAWAARRRRARRAGALC